MVFVHMFCPCIIVRLSDISDILLRLVENLEKRSYQDNDLQCEVVKYIKIRVLQNLQACSL